MAEITTPWIDYTPTDNDISAPEWLDLLVAAYTADGVGTRRARSRRAGGRLEFAYLAVWGTTAPLTNPTHFSSTISAPAGTNGLELLAVPALACDYSAQKFYRGLCLANVIDVNSIALTWVFGDNAAPAHATSPFTWAQGDWLISGNVIEAFDN